MKKARKKKPARKRKKGALITPLGLACVFLGLFVFMTDQLSKYFVQDTIPRMNHETQWYPYGGIGVFEDFFGVEFSIVHATNRGAAWGVFSEFQDYLFVFRIVFIIGLVIYLVRYNKNKELTIPLTLIIAGAIGNIVDYVVYGHVVDMFHFVLWGYDYPVFNIADSSICIGVIGVIFLTLFYQKKTLFSKA